MNRTPILAALAVLALPAAPLSSADYDVDDDHTFALFRIQHMNAGFTWGRFDAIAGQVSYDPANPAGNAISLTIQAASVSTGVSKMEDHLKTPDFFDVKQFPTLTFTSKSFAKRGEGQYEVSGDLTIRGITKPITVQATRAGISTHAFSKKPLVGFETVFEVNRNDFGITYGPGVVGDTVRITLAVEAVGK
jgi:polyisoprenoid-binding protein YceI